MQGDSALCFPFVSQTTLVNTNSLSLVNGQHTSQQWAAILHAFLQEHRLVEEEGDLSRSGSALEGSVVSRRSLGLDLDGEEILQSGAEFASSEPVFFTDLLQFGSSAGLVDMPQETLFSPSASVASHGGQSVVTSYSMSRSVWNAMRPSLGNPLDSQGLEHNSWFKPWLLLQQDVISLSASLDAVLDKLPVVFDHLDSKAEDLYARKAGVGASLASLDSAVASLQSSMSQLWIDSSKSMMDIKLLVQGPEATTNLSVFLAKHGSVLQAIDDISTSIQEWDAAMHAGAGLTSTVELNQRFLDLATKAAGAVRASADHAMAQRLILSDRIDSLEAALSAERAAGDPLEDIFATALNGLTRSPVPPPVDAAASP
jgi:hypothetical protein